MASTYTSRSGSSGTAGSCPEAGGRASVGSAGVLSRRIRARKISPVDLADACLARAQALGPSLGCVVTIAAERARADARQAERDVAAGRWRGPPHGVPYGLVDLVDTKGIRTTFGARPFAG